MRHWLTPASLLVVLLASATCSRSALDIPPPLPPQPECDVDADCPGFDNLCEPTQCVDTEDYEGELPELPAGVPLPPRVCIVLEPIDCDDDDPCTEDECQPITGECLYGPATFDLDEDGFNGPLPGKKAGEPDSCGDDCDDTSPLAYPGNTEVCDGIDNDCNGIVDDNASFIPLDDEPIRISGDIAPSGPGGLAFNGESYLATYTGTTADDDFQMFRTRLTIDAEKVDPIEEPISLQNSDSYGAPIVWIGDRYGLAWQDRRDGDYEVYFSLLDADGAKVIPDTRLSNAFDFSVNVNLAWTGNEFIVVWQDRRSGLFEVFAQRIDVDGNLIGDNQRLSPNGGFDDESPIIASGDRNVGVAWANGVAGLQTIRFQTFEKQTLEPQTELLTLTDGSSEAVYPTVVWNADRYIVAWYERTGANKAIFATTVSPDGEILTPATPLSMPGAFRSRYPSLLPLGDRALVVYSDDRDGNTGYELYSRMVDSELLPLTEEFRITNAAFDSITPVTTFGPEGDVGILFRDDREGGEHHVWFTRLGCITTVN